MLILMFCVVNGKVTEFNISLAEYYYFCHEKQLVLHMCNSLNNTFH